VGLIASLSGLGLYGVQQANAASPDATWEKSDSESYTQAGAQTGLYHASSVGWYGAAYRSDYDTWRHDFRVSSTGSARHTEHETKLQRLNEHYCGFRYGTTEGFYISIHDKHHGVWPEIDTDDTYDHTDLAKDIAEKAITTLSSYADFALTAATFAENLTPDNTTVSSSDYDYLNKWGYDGEKTDAGHFRRFIAETGSQESTFTVKTGSICTGYDLHPTTKFIFNIRKGYTPTEGKFSNYSKTETTSYGTELFRPREGWLIERISHSNIMKRGKDLGLSKKQIEEHYENNGPLFYAHQAPIRLLE
jgi:hypothetical protein